ncbi:uncharacterized protein LOC114252408, partial [Bombyx mandarina]|uniref:Uncharacterized protein LOC114252408 n=1 Tax=Bombyx mandarina TaxID=7092 RepID=A0A6J2KRB3_BOMMA
SALTNNCEIIQYADDICIYRVHENINEGSLDINACLDSVGNWLLDHGFDVAPIKSQVVLFSRKRSPPNISIVYQGYSIPLVTEAKFLGLILDAKLTGSAHVDNTVKKCEKNINVLRALSGTWWGAHPYSQKLLYNALVRSIIDFGSIFLQTSTKSILSRLDSVQFKALRIVLGAMKSSPTRALQVESAEPPLSLRRQYLSDRYTLRLAQIHPNAIISKLSALQNCMTSNFWNSREQPCLIKS